MTTDQLNEDQKSHGGLGRGFFQRDRGGTAVAVHPDGSYGWDGGLGTTWLVDPARDLVVIVLTQLMFATSTPPRVHSEIQAAARVAAVRLVESPLSEEPATGGGATVHPQVGGFSAGRTGERIS